MEELIALCDPTLRMNHEICDGLAEMSSDYLMPINAVGAHLNGQNSCIAYGLKVAAVVSGSAATAAASQRRHRTPHELLVTST